MTDQQDGRAGFGNRLRRLRVDAELSGKQLAERLSWPASKVSRLENGRQTASTDDVRAWTTAVDAPVQPAGEIRHLAAPAPLRLRPRQRAGLTLEHGTAQLRAVETAIVPGLLQTADYARHVYAGLAANHGSQPDVDEAVRTRLRRQEVLYHPERRFRFLVTEAALRTRPCPVPVLRAQLDRLLVLAGLDTVELAVLPFSAHLTEAPSHGFWIFDDNLVLVETINAELAIRDRDDIALYERLFEAYWEVASHGADAFALITTLALELNDPGAASR